MNPVDRSNPLTALEKYEVNLNETGTKLGVTTENANTVQGVGVAVNAVAAATFGLGIALCATPAVFLGIGMVATSVIGLATGSTAAHMGKVKNDEALRRHRSAPISAPPPLVSPEENIKQKKWTHESAKFDNQETKKPIAKTSRIASMPCEFDGSFSPEEDLELNPSTKFHFGKDEALKRQRSAPISAPLPLVSPEENIKQKKWTHESPKFDNQETKKPHPKKSLDTSEEDHDVNPSVNFNFGEDPFDLYSSFKSGEEVTVIGNEKGAIKKPSNLEIKMAPGDALKVLFEFADAIHLSSIIRGALKIKDTLNTKDTLKPNEKPVSRNFITQAIIDKLKSFDTTGVLVRILISEISVTEAIIDKLKNLDKTGILGRLLESSTTGPKITGILSAILSMASAEEFFWAGTGGISNWCTSKNPAEAFLEIPKVKQMLDAFSSLNDYLNEFKDHQNVLNFEAFCIGFLKDKTFLSLWKQPENIELLCSMCCLAEIPQFEHEEAYQMLKLFSLLHRELANFPDAKKSKLLKFTDIAKLFFEVENKPLIDLAHKFLTCLEDSNINPTVKVYALPFLTPIHLLALPKIEGIFAKMSKKNMYDCRIEFEKHEEQLGHFLTTPVANYIHTRNLSKYFFNSPKREENAIQVKFENLLLENFSFVSSQFYEIEFKNVSFKNCDFKKSLFLRCAKFSNVILDTATANDFLKSLDISFSRDSVFVLRGRFTIIGDAKEMRNVKIPKRFNIYKEKNKPVIICQVK